MKAYTSIRLSDNIAARLRTFASERNISIGEAVSQLLTAADIAAVKDYQRDIADIKNAIHDIRLILKGVTE